MQENQSGTNPARRANRRAQHASAPPQQPRTYDWYQESVAIFLLGCPSAKQFAQGTVETEYDGEYGSENSRANKQADAQACSRSSFSD